VQWDLRQHQHQRRQLRQLWHRLHVDQSDLPERRLRVSHEPPDRVQ
jgi:hypothetical protein